MKNIVVSDIIKQNAPGFKGAAVSCSVINSEPDENLWKNIDSLCLDIESKYQIDQINKRIEIKATRDAYKALGKDPNRYRPSAESLCRRIVKEKSLYKINTLVDLINLVSIKSGYSIGGFDENKIVGDTLTLTAGTADDLFHGIGRGVLNIENLPLYKDDLGGIGTPTSDEERTKLTLKTIKLLMVINGYDGGSKLKDTVDESVALLKEYANGDNFEIIFFD
ncbi:MAG: phenylalanine--tRNA ligase beta subunit-related protein [Bacteroidales bacterium]|nr:phenylalanine--tRNA ligase beta subunit-related protein [Bacteroidales bacterium]